MDTASDTCLWPCGYWHILVSSCSASTRDLEKLDITQTATVNRPLDQSEVSIEVGVLSTNESSPGVVHQPQPALLRLAAQLQTQQALVLVSQGGLDTRCLH